LTLSNHSEKLPIVSLWSHRDFRLLWAGDTVSQFGAMVGQTALPLLAVGTLAATPFQMGALTAANTAAFLLIGLPAGVWVDRLRRRPLMLTADLVRAVLMLSVPLAWWAGALSLIQLLVVALLTGVCTVFFDVAYQSYLPALVGRDQLVEGNSKLQASQSVAQISGPALAGGLAQIAGAANAVLVTGLGYLGSALFLLRIRVPEPEPERTGERRLAAEIAEGLRFVFGNRSLRAIIGCTGTSNFFSGVEAAVVILFLTNRLGLSPGQIGALLSVGGVGGVLAALTARRWTTKFGQARSIWLSMVLTQPFGLLVPSTGHGWWIGFAVIGYTAVGYGVIVYNIAQVSFRQAICPERLLGRMNASIRFVVWGTMPIGGLVGGLLGEWVGVLTTLWISVVGMLLSCAFVVFSPLRKPVEGVVAA
jgi:MFS family permease